ncbi:MAG TPA: hypothetical protein VGW38_01945 [Chloroflexota bacterium]|nr:hypothetical protein [Chloroflexota bacterium]
MLVRKLTLDHLKGQDLPRELETEPGVHTENKSRSGRASLQVNWLWTAWLLMAGLFLYVIANPTLQ